MQISQKVTGLSPAVINKFRSFERKFMGALNAADARARTLIAHKMREVMEHDWPPNADEYRKWKMFRGYDTRPLFRTHILANSISHERTAFSPAFIHGEVGWHSGMQYGGTIRRPLREGSPQGRASTKRKRPLVSMDMGPMSQVDTRHLAQVALWNDKGGNHRPPRPFVSTTFGLVTGPVIAIFTKALMRNLPVTGLADAPFSGVTAAVSSPSDGFHMDEF